MKKFLALFLAVVMVLGLTAILASCKEDEKSTESSTQAEEKPTESDAGSEGDSNESNSEEGSDESSSEEGSDESSSEEGSDESSSEEGSDESSSEEGSDESSSEEGSDESTSEEDSTESTSEEATGSGNEDLDPELGNLKTVLSYPWYNFDYTKQDGLQEVVKIDMHERGLDCATPNGWTKVVVYYIPNKKPSGGAFSSSDYLAIDATRGVSLGSYSFGVRFQLGQGLGSSTSATLYSAGNALMTPKKINKTEYQGRYAMFVQTFSAEKEELWVNGVKAYSCAPTYPQAAQQGLNTISHKVMILNGYIAEGASNDDAIDQYKEYGIKLMYATAYAYVADEKAIAAFYDYYVNKKDLPEVETHEMTFEDPESDLSLNVKDERPSNYADLLEHKYFEYDFSTTGGLKKIQTVDLKVLWSGALAGRTLIGLYNIPEAVYTDKDFIGFMEYHDYTNGDYDGALQFNLGTGLVSAVNSNFVTTLNSVAKEVHPTGWTLFVESYDGETMKVWCNDELIFVGSTVTSGILQYYTLGGTADSSSRERLNVMIINGYAALKTPHEKAVDLYDAYGISMDYAAMYSVAANENAAHEIYQKFVGKYTLTAPSDAE